MQLFYVTLCGPAITSSYFHVRVTIVNCRAQMLVDDHGVSKMILPSMRYLNTFVSCVHGVQ